MTTIDQERRRFQRVGFDATIVLSQADERWCGRLLDISLHGLLVERPVDWNGDGCLPFRARIVLSAETQLQMEVQQAHEKDGALGFTWLHIDIDSFSHLRRLLELNTGDAVSLEREVASLGQS